MAVSANIVWEVRTTGSSTNGGGWKAGASGTDYSLQDAAQYSLTNGVATTGSATINTVSAAANMVGNIVYVSGGTGSITAGRYEIISQVTGTSITLDRSTGLVTGTGVTLNIGGAVSLPSIATAAGSSGNTVYVKAGTYTVSAVTTNQDGGQLIGYSTNRNPYNTDTQPVLSSSANSLTFFNGGNSNFGFDEHIHNIKFDANGHTNCTGMNTGSNTLITRVTIKGCTTGFAFGGQYTTARNCFADTCGVGFSATGTARLYWCMAKSCTTNGFAISSGTAVCESCIAYGGSGGAGFTNNGYQNFINCVAYGTTGDGFATTATGHRTTYTNCVAVGNSGYGFSGGGVAYLELENCAGYNNTTANYGNQASTTPQYTIVDNFVVLTGDPFTSASTLDFSVNSTAGAGAALKAASFPSSFFGTITNNYRDLGAAQHADAPGGGVTHLAGRGGGLVA